MVLALGCCPAGTAPGRAVERRGGKALAVAASVPADLHPAADRDVHGWAPRLARLVGAHRESVAAGVPVPLAHHLLTWSDVRRELDAGRWDLVVVDVTPAEAGPLVDAPDLLLRVLDDRLRALAPQAGEDPVAASQVADLLALRPCLVLARELAASAAAVGRPEQHVGCSRPGALGLATVDASDPAGRPRPAVSVTADGHGFVWALELPDERAPELAREDDRLVVRSGDRLRTFRLPAALARCRVRAADVVPGRLQVLLEPDPDAWR